MAVHTIMLPDDIRDGARRSIVWDDEAGTATGEHSALPWIQEMLARTPPVEWRHVAGTAVLIDPGHDPADFLFLLGEAYWEVLVEPLRSALPPVFTDVEATAYEGTAVPNADGLYPVL